MNSPSDWGEYSASPSWSLCSRYWRRATRLSSSTRPGWRRWSVIWEKSTKSATPADIYRSRNISRSCKVTRSLESVKWWSLKILCRANTRWQTSRRNLRCTIEVWKYKMWPIHLFNFPFKSFTNYMRQRFYVHQFLQRWTIRERGWWKKKSLEFYIRIKLRGLFYKK